MISLITIFRLKAANRILKARFKELSTEKAFADAEQTIRGVSEERLDDFVKALQDLEQTETKRCEVIDTKSHIIIAASATALALLCKLAEPAASAAAANQFSVATIALQILIIITGISWVAAAIYAFCVTKVTGLHQLSSTDLQTWLPNEYCLKKMTAAKRLSGIQANESKLLIKINYLSTAQSFFVEGLTSLLFVLLVMMVAPWVHCPQWHTGILTVFYFALMTSMIGGEIIAIILIFLSVKLVAQATSYIRRAVKQLFMGSSSLKRTQA